MVVEKGVVGRWDIVVRGGHGAFEICTKGERKAKFFGEKEEKERKGMS